MSIGLKNLENNIRGSDADSLKTISDQIDGVATPTNITAGTITTVTNLTNAATSGDLTATMKASVNAEVDTALNTIVPASPTAGSVNDIMSKAAGANTFDKSTDSLEAIRDKIDTLSFDTNIYATLTEANVSTIADGEIGVVSDSGVVGYNDLTLTYNQINDSNFGGGNCTILDVCFVDYNKYIIVYADQGNSNYITARCCTTASTGITLGTELVISSYTISEVRIEKLSTNKAVLLYTASADSHLQGRILSVSGTTITAGTLVEILAAAVTRIGLAVLSSTKFATVMLNPNLVSCFICTVSELTITPGSVATVVTATDNCGVGKIGTDKIAVVYKKGDDKGYCKIGTIATTTPTFGDEVNFYNDTLSASYPMECKSLATDSFIVMFAETATTDEIFGIAATVSGTVPTFGDTVNYKSWDGAAPQMNILPISSTSYMAQYGANSADIYYRISTVSGTTITIGTEVTITGVASSIWYKAAYSGQGYYVFCGGSNGSYDYTLEEYYTNATYPARQFAGVANEAVSQAGSGDFVQRGVKTGMTGLDVSKSLWLDTVLGGLKWRPLYYVDAAAASTLCLKPLSSTIALL